MSKIVRVDIIDNTTLDLELDNGSLILFDLKSTIDRKSEYKKLNHLELLPAPKTDGERIFWNDEINITLTEILDSLH